MYERLTNNSTKQGYRQLLLDTYSIVEKRIETSSSNDELMLWQDIIYQINDIRVFVTAQNCSRDWKEIYQRYSIGRIAVQCFDENDEMNHRLSDIFYGAVHYREFAD